MDLFDAKIALITLKERIIYEYKNYLMNKKIISILKSSFSEKEKIEKISSLIIDNKNFQPSIMIDKIGEYEFVQTEIYVPEDPIDTVPYYIDYLKMKKQGLENFRQIGSKTYRSSCFDEYESLIDDKKYFLCGNPSFYEKIYDQYHRDYTKIFASVPQEIKENSTCTISIHTLSNGDSSEAYIYHFSQELIKQMVHQYALKFVRRYSLEQQTHTIK